ncbi:MAG: TaqI-like C-terminal specificity domain-containing protein [Patescibacteria group bacterium]|nr:TaqI-like C-terminal specificity domain-containing protein [Patescibacteria group bacterium]
MNKQEAREKIKKLIERYKDLSEAQIKGYNEQQTKDHFIRPLFEALGWNFEEEVWPETDVSGKRVDYSLKIHGITKFYVEAKALSVNLDEERWAEQAINYSWHKSVPWVVLTDFEAIKIYNTEWDEPNIQSCQFIEIPYVEYLVDDRLWWLSRESFEKGILDKEAEKMGRRPKRIIDDQLAEDLVSWRERLYKELKNYNPKIDIKVLSEWVQKILDRLIFIRTLEDRRIEDVILQPLARNWEEKGRSGELLADLNKIFRRIDKIYNSGLFEEAAYDHLGDKINADDHDFADVINELYKTKKKGIRYNFADIPSDVFGNIYEQYLGHIQAEDTGSGKTSKRKSQGIYYTPRYIVDYIVKNTIGEILKDKKPEEVKNIKILDPACGSGSFLITAYQTLLDYWQKHEKKEVVGASKKINDLEKVFQKINGDLLSPEQKMRILLNNIYGVDLDEEAVEIAKLNLLLKMVGRPAKLPSLANNIQVGNSLISGTEEELKKSFGNNWQDKKPFNWQEKFKSVFDQGGFDVIIGNPPYIRNRELNEDDKKYFNDFYDSASGQYDIYQLFFERSIKLLKDDGYLGFITSNKYAIADYGKKLREFILDNCRIIGILDVSNLQVFKEASTYPYVIILKKTKKNEGHKISGYKIEDALNLFENEIIINQDDIKATSHKNFTIKNEPGYFKRIEAASVKFGNIATIKETIHTGNIRDKLVVDEQIDKKCKKLLAGRDCHRYWFKWGGKYIRYDKDLIDKGNKEYANLVEPKYFEKPKILLREIADRIEACYDDEKYYTLNKVYSVQPNDDEKYHLKYILALLNSSLLSFYYREKFEEAHIRGGYLQFKKIYTSQIPIRRIDFNDKNECARHDKLVCLVDKILNLYKELKRLDPIIDKRECSNGEEKINKIDVEIDQLVYGLYGLKEKDVRNIEVV